MSSNAEIARRKTGLAGIVLLILCAAIVGQLHYSTGPLPSATQDRFGPAYPVSAAILVQTGIARMAILWGDAILWGETIRWRKTAQGTVGPV
ncbi:MAG TPA: hypothetical protein VE398_09665 [Acidobacteriota bacterium]|nr:hypothetical protein [Acidobacteriota bacterium]